MTPVKPANARTGLPIEQTNPHGQVLADAVPVQLPEDVMLDIAYAAFRLHGGDEARTLWQINRPLAARLQPAADTRQLIGRQNRLAAQPAGVNRSKCFHDDLGQVGSVPVPLRASALVALGRSIVLLPVADQLQAFQGILSAMVLLPGPDRAPTMALWPLAALVHNLGLTASQALHDFLKNSENWRGAENVIAVVMGHLLSGKVELLSRFVDEVKNCPDPHALSGVLLALISDPAFSDTENLLTMLCVRLGSCASGPAQLACLDTAARMIGAGNKNRETASEAVRVGLRYAARYKPVADIVQDLMARHGGSTAHYRLQLMEVLSYGLLWMPVSAGWKTAWKQLVVSALTLPESTFRKSELPRAIAIGLCNMLPDADFQQTFEVLVDVTRDEPPGPFHYSLRHLLQDVAAGLHRVENDADRVAAFECLLAAFRCMDQAHRGMAIGCLMDTSSHHLPLKLEMLFDVVLGEEAGIAYEDQARILCSIKLYPQYHGRERIVPVFLEQWLCAMEKLGGPLLNDMLAYFASELETDPAIAMHTPAVMTKLTCDTPRPADTATSPASKSQPSNSQSPPAQKAAASE